MKKFLMAVAALACMGGVALAGPNAGGTITAHDASYVYTTDTAAYCGLGAALTTCDGADVIVEGATATEPKVWKVYAAFLDNSAPRLKGMTFGINYNATELILVGQGPCIGDPNNGAAEFPGAGWPGSDTGTSIVFQFTQTSQLVECYWFAGYSYYGNPSIFQLRQHPDPILAGNFADDSVPAIQDPIAGFGSIGFDVPGVPACPQGQPEGACCIGTECTITIETECAGEWQGAGTTCEPETCAPPPVFGACCFEFQCYFVTQDECVRMGGVYQGDNVECNDTICAEPPNPTEQTSWGQIKANYR